MQMAIRKTFGVMAMVVFLFVSVTMLAHAEPVQGSIMAAPPAPAGTERAVISNMYLMNSTGFFRWGDTMRVIVTGTPGAFAMFDVMKLQHSVAMTEVSPGSYEGTLQIDDTMRIDDTPLVGHLYLITAYQANAVHSVGIPAVYRASVRVTIGTGAPRVPPQPAQ